MMLMWLNISIIVILCLLLPASRSLPLRRSCTSICVEGSSAVGIDGFDPAVIVAAVAAFDDVVVVVVVVAAHDE